MEDRKPFCDSEPKDIIARPVNLGYNYIMPLAHSASYKDKRIWLKIIQCQLEAFPSRERMMRFFLALEEELVHILEQAGVDITDDFDSKKEVIFQALANTGKR